MRSAGAPHSGACRGRAANNVTCYIQDMPRRRIHSDGSPAARMRRSRAALAARGGRLVQLRLDGDARRALAALELTSPAASRAEVTARALSQLAARRRFPLRLSREEEVRLAALAVGPFTPAAFRATGYADVFVAGVAIALATDRALPRDRLLALARTLAPGIATADGYRRWLQASPIRLARFFKLVDIERGIARARTAA